MAKNFQHSFPRQVDSLIGELAYRDSAILVQKLCADLETWVVDELVLAETDERRLYLQVYAQLVRDLKKKLRQNKGVLEKDTPRVLT